MKRIIIIILLFIIPIICYSQKKYSISASLVVDNIYKIEIGTVNLIAFSGKDGLLLSDCGYKSSSTQLDSLISTLSSNPVKYVVNTHWHHDHCGGNFFFYKNAIIIAHNDTRDILTRNYFSSFWEEEYKAFPDYALPDITFRDKMILYFNGEEIELHHMPGGHSNGDIVVYFKKSKVIHLGDLLFSFGFPAIDFEHGGNVKQFAENLQTIINMIPDDVIIVAGHGPNFSVNQLKAYRNMVLETLSIIEKSMAQGLRLKEIKQKNVLKDYENWEKGYFSCDDWIEIVYSSLIYDNN